MKKLFLLSKQDINFAKEEVLALYKPKDYKLIEDCLVINTDKDYSDRLALTKNIYQIIKISNEKDLEKTIKEISWEKIIGKNSYKLILTKSIKKNLANIIYERLNKPKVDLKNPIVTIEIIKRNNNFYICKLESIISTSWKKRLPHLKPELSPTSLNPRIAMAMINLSGIDKGIILDPFCGTGGILVEAGLMNHEIIGVDIDKMTLKKAKINLDHYKIKNYRLIEEDALKINEDYEQSSNLSQVQSFDLVITDLPYGKNTKISANLEKLYAQFFKKYYKKCDIMVIGLPDFIDHKRFLHDWKIKQEFNLYMHKNLSKKILVLKL